MVLFIARLSQLNFTSIHKISFVSFSLCSNQQDYTRVWLLCEVQVSRLLPQWITDYAARRAMPRATTWLRPQVEAANAAARELVPREYDRHLLLVRVRARAS